MSPSCNLPILQIFVEQSPYDPYNAEEVFQGAALEQQTTLALFLIELQLNLSGCNTKYKGYLLLNLH